MTSTKEQPTPAPFERGGDLAAVVDPMVAMIERIALDPNADLSKLEKMLEMRERIEEREARRAFDQALASAKADIGPIERSGEVEYKSERTGDVTFFRHETLDGIAKAVDPILSKHGLSYRFRSEQKEGLLHVTCILAHRDGHSEETTLSGSPDTSGQKNNYQAVGSAATYLQRYTLKLALGLSAARDNDATGATGPEPITEEQFLELRDMLEKAGLDQSVVERAEKLQSLKLLPAKRFPAVKAKLQKDIGNV